MTATALTDLGPAPSAPGTGYAWLRLPITPTAPMDVRSGDIEVTIYSDSITFDVFTVPFFMPANVSVEVTFGAIVTRYIGRSDGTFTIRHGVTRAGAGIESTLSIVAREDRR